VEDATERVWASDRGDTLKQQTGMQPSGQHSMTTESKDKWMMLNIWYMVFKIYKGCFRVYQIPS